MAAHIHLKQCTFDLLNVRHFSESLSSLIVVICAPNRFALMHSCLSAERSVSACPNQLLTTNWFGTRLWTHACYQCSSKCCAHLVCGLIVWGSWFMFADFATFSSCCITTWFACQRRILCGFDWLACMLLLFFMANRLGFPSYQKKNEKCFRHSSRLSAVFRSVRATFEMQISNKLQSCLFHFFNFMANFDCFKKVLNCFWVHHTSFNRFCVPNFIAINANEEQGAHLHFPSYEGKNILVFQCLCDEIRIWRFTADRYGLERMA